MTDAWQRLSLRTLPILLAGAVRTIVTTGWPLVISLFVGTENRWILTAQLVPTVAAVAVPLLAIARWLTTQYRVTSERFEHRSGLIRRSQTAIPRDRIRTVDVTAAGMYRLLGLTSATIGIGNDEPVVLNGLTTAVAGALRDELLHREHRTDRRTELLRLHRRWIRFSPFTVTGLVAAGTFVTVLSQVSRAVDSVAHETALHTVAGWAVRPSVGVLATALTLATIAIVPVLSTLGYMEAFWGYRLSRHPAGTLHVVRGLITRRATTIERRRLRGVELREPLLTRWLGGASLVAIATGAQPGVTPEHSASLLVPPAPVGVVTDVATEIVGTADPLMCALSSHGPRARRRCHTRALVPWALAVAELNVAWAFLGCPAWPCAIAVALLPAVVVLAESHYRSLGHAFADGYLVTRAGSLLRRRVVLDARGIVSWTLATTYLQRRAGLATLIAATAAGDRAYEVIDLPIDEARRFARRVRPDLLSPFDERVTRVRVL